MGRDIAKQLGMIFFNCPVGFRKPHKLEQWFTTILIEIRFSIFFGVVVSMGWNVTMGYLPLWIVNWGVEIFLFRRLFRTELPRKLLLDVMRTFLN